MPKSVMITRIASVAIVAGSVIYCTYSQYSMDRKMNEAKKSMQDGMNRIRDAVKNLGKN